MYLQYIDKVRPFFGSEGFIYNSKLQAFVKKNGDIEDRFIVAKDRTIQVRLEYGIQFKTVNEIYARILGVKASNSWNTIFIGNSAMDNSILIFFITSDEEINSGVKQTLRAYQKYALPYFNQYSSLEALDHLLNNEDLDLDKIDNLKYHNNELESIMMGLITAKLLGRQDYNDIEKKRWFLLKENLREDIYKESEEKILKVREFDVEPFKKKLKLI